MSLCFTDADAHYRLRLPKLRAQRDVQPRPLRLFLKNPICSLAVSMGPIKRTGALCPAPGRPEALLACSIKATVFGPGGPFEMQPGARLLPEGFRLPASAAKGRPPGGPQGKAFRVLPGHRARPPPAQAERANAHALLLRPLLPGAASAPRPQRSETCTAKISCGISTPR